MPGRGRLGPPPPVVQGLAAQFVVSRYRLDDPERAWDDLPWLVYVGDQRREGSTPASARLRFFLADQAPDGWPRRFEDALELDEPTPFRLVYEDRLSVRRLYPDGTYRIVRDGFIRLPQVDVGPDQEAATVELMDCPIREFDTPLALAMVRDSDDLARSTDATTDAPKDYWTRDPIRFNPDGRPNCTPDGDDAYHVVYGEDDAPKGKHAVFCQPGLKRDPPGEPRPWTLALAVEYLAWTGNAEELFVHNVRLGEIKDILKAVVPSPEGGVVDPADPATYEYQDIVVSDVGDLAGKSWCEAVEQLIEPHGFGFRWVLEQHVEEESGGDPERPPEPRPYHAWTVYRRDQPVGTLTGRKVLLQRAGTPVDLAKSNVTALSLTREYPRASRYEVRSALRRYQVGIVLYPGFQPVAGDQAVAVRDKYRKGHPDFEAHVNDYRLWHAAEGGDRFWSFDLNDWSKRPLDLAPLFPDEEDERRYHVRRRPGLKDLLTEDDLGLPEHAQLWISADWGIAPVSGEPYPVLYDGARPNGVGHWQRVTKGGWRLLEDRFGIYLDVQSPWDWEIGFPPDATAGPNTLNGGKLDVIKCMAAPDMVPPAPQPLPANPRFWLMLEAVFEGETDLDIVAEARSASPAGFPITRHEDSKDRYRYDVVTKFGRLGGGVEAVVRDDTDAANKRALVRRAVAETGYFAGRVQVPWYSEAYEIGDFLTEIDGRDVDLNGLAAGQQKQRPVYPQVVGVDRTSEPPNQGTVLHLGDRRAEPPHIARTPKPVPTLADLAIQKAIEDVTLGPGPGLLRQVLGTTQ